MKTLVALLAVFCLGTNSVRAQQQDKDFTYLHDAQGRLIAAEGIANGVKTKVELWYFDDNGQPTKLVYAQRFSTFVQQPDGSYKLVPGPWRRIADNSVDPNIPDSKQP